MSLLIKYFSDIIAMSNIIDKTEPVTIFHYKLDAFAIHLSPLNSINTHQKKTQPDQMR